jgi:hypothetical protein
MKKNVAGRRNAPNSSVRVSRSTLRHSSPTRTCSSRDRATRIPDTG